MTPMMVHSYNDSLYNRAYNLPALGFDHPPLRPGLYCGAPL